MNQETITISKQVYTELLEDSKFLSCLEGAGVDNWDGYEAAQEMYSELYPSADEEN